jgi:hypothetical protein
MSDSSEKNDWRTVREETFLNTQKSHEMSDRDIEITVEIEKNILAA